MRPRWRIRHGRVVGVFPAIRADSGWTTSGAPLATQIAQALGLADLTRRALPFGSIALRQLMIHLAGAELLRLLPASAEAF